MTKNKLCLYDKLTGAPIELIEHTEYSDCFFFKVWGALWLAQSSKNLPLMHFILNNLLFLLVALPCLWFTQSHMVGLGYLLVHYFLFFGRYMCYIHEYSHTQVFKNRKLGSLITNVLVGQFHGLPFNSYYINHVIMHHKGANKWNWDLSSCVKYDRMSKSHFLYYWVRHYTPITFPIDMVYVCFLYKKYGYGFVYFVTVLTWYGIIYLGMNSQYHVFVLWTMLVPLFLTGFFGACGGWMQHMFVHPTKPDKWYSFDIINSVANTKGFNQGFHNTHHTLGHLHWTEVPNGFYELLPEYTKDNVLIMHTLDNVQILWLVLSGQLEELAKYMVTTNPCKTPLEDCVRMLRLHLLPIKYSISSMEMGLLLFLLIFKFAYDQDPAMLKQWWNDWKEM